MLVRHKLTQLLSWRYSPTKSLHICLYRMVWENFCCFANVPRRKETMILIGISGQCYLFILTERILEIFGFLKFPRRMEIMQH